MRTVKFMTIWLTGMLTPCLLTFANPRAMVLDDFNRTEGDGGVSQGVWTKKQGWAQANLSQAEKAGEAGGSLELGFAVEKKDQEAGYWIALSQEDLGRTAALSFWIKGKAGGEQISVGLRDRLNFEDKLPIQRYLEGGINTAWQKVVVPLGDFTRIRDWYSVRTLSFTAGYAHGPVRRGTVFIDEINLEGERAAVPALQPAIVMPPPLTELNDEAFLDMIQKTAAMFFWHEANPDNGLIKDHCNRIYPDNYKMASIASVGFGLPALCVAESRGWLPRDDVYGRILATLRFFRDRAESVHGFYYHFLDMDTGERWNNCELSSIDSGLLMAGVVFAGEYFKGTEIEQIARQLYERVDWKWMLNGGATLSMGWSPEGGFIDARWATYDEQAVLDMLAIGAPKNAVPPALWHAVGRPRNDYGPYSFFGVTPLFTHQYSHMFIDFRLVRDDYMDYFENSIQATLAHRQWAIDHMHISKTYGPDSWGLTACDGPDGYKAYGAPHGPNDGTVAPTAAGGSFAFTPKYSMWMFKHLYQNYRDKLWGRYGFADAYNWDRDWVSSVHIGIDQGPIVLMIENHRSGMVWRHFMRNRHVVQGLRLAGFKAKDQTVETIDLGGAWHFQPGDHPQIAQATKPDPAWSVVLLPSHWETQGFPGLDGYGWYWKSFALPAGAAERWKGLRIVLEFGGVDDADQTFVNGIQAGSGGTFPPAFQTAFDKPRRYELAPAQLHFEGLNFIAIRVYDAQGGGGPWKGPVRVRAVRVL